MDNALIKVIYSLLLNGTSIEWRVNNYRRLPETDDRFIYDVELRIGGKSLTYKLLNYIANDRGKNE